MEFWTYDNRKDGSLIYFDIGRDYACFELFGIMIGVDY